jgi:hypothetical protein
LPICPLHHKSAGGQKARSCAAPAPHPTIPRDALCMDCSHPVFACHPRHDARGDSICNCLCSLDPPLQSWRALGWLPRRFKASPTHMRPHPMHAYAVERWKGSFCGRCLTDMSCFTGFSQSGQSHIMTHMTVKSCSPLTFPRKGAAPCLQRLNVTKVQWIRAAGTLQATGIPCLGSKICNSACFDDFHAFHLQAILPQRMQPARGRVCPPAMPHSSAHFRSCF